MSETSVTDYRSTLNLPKTVFPMKADLPKREPDRVAWWREQRVYERRLERNAGNAPWILHDGPPYANGEVHMGTFLNRTLKDIFVKVHLLDGQYAKFVPGWDMHGLPIEFETLKHLKLDFRKVDPIALRAKCRERALHWLDVQRETFLRIGLLGDYEHPYRTIDKEFEATIVETLADLAETSQLYKGLRPTLWCVHDETALAEAEIEYKEHVSSSIYVRFTASLEQRADFLRRFGVHAVGFPERLSMLIWTTTPWTLPANVAIALKPDAEYGLYRAEEELYIVATALEGNVRARAGTGAGCGFTGDVVCIAAVEGAVLKGASVRHPFLERDSEIVLADYVELDTGTGAVHTAPGHGTDDFDTGTRFGLPMLSPVDARGRFTAEAGSYAGMPIFDANERIVADLRASGALWAFEKYEHSYPHCWRCKNPVIFRATAQWFIAMDVNHLRKRAADKVSGVRWYPAWGETRMLQMIENHPEWCISRQRMWGTPIPALACKHCNEAFIDPDVARRVARLFRERCPEGGNASDLWWTEDVAVFLPPDSECPKCRGREFAKEFNIVDIWFESGVTHRAVLKQRPGLRWPADLYLEGSDQYRGWFRSNLITAIATQGAAPYKAVVSTGWVVDADGRAMHKSAKNYVAAKEAMQKYGADVLRLWTASVEFTVDMRFGDALLESVGSVYRNFRYRLRMLLGLIDDLEPEHLLVREQLELIDCLALAKLDEVAHVMVTAYKEYRLHDVYLALVAYDAEDLSRFYIDVLKDPLYSGVRDGRRRRSAQTVLFTILKNLCALLAPLLSFTAEEAWQCVPERLRAGEISVFDLHLPSGLRPDAREQVEIAEWELLKSLRATVAASEGMRDFQLQARVFAGGKMYERLRALGDNLREALVVSALTLHEDEKTEQPRVELVPAEGEKCLRCWKYRTLGADTQHPRLCGPCAATVG
jgi:isoleucyl-tRNA synthetase